MRLSLVTVKRRPDSDEVSRRETLLEGEALRVGRGADVDVNLPDVDVAYHHATLTEVDGGVQVSAVGGAVMLSEGKPVEDVMLRAGMSVRIGPFELTAENAPDHADRAIALSKLDQEEAVDEAPQRIVEALPTRRRLSWLLVAAVLALFVAWPLFDILQRTAPAPNEIVVAGMVTPKQAEAQIAAAAITEGEAPAWTAAKFSPLEGTWTSGPMSKAHAGLGEDCGACHLRPFEMTTNAACLSCHAEVPQHANPKSHPIMKLDYPEQSALVSLDYQRCGACHKEHEGGDAPVEQASALCVDCHKQLDAFTDYEGGTKTDLGNVNDFGVDHPAFRPTVVTGAQLEDGELKPLSDRAPVGVSIKDLKEVSGLIFPHNRHLNKDGLPRYKSEGGEKWTLSCASCHVSEADGALMRPIEMERDCGYCHELKFETPSGQPNREVPHAKADEVAQIVYDYYSARALEELLDAAAAAPVTRRARPGVAAEAPVGNKDEALAQAKVEAERELEAIFGARLCGDCHVAQLDEARNDRDQMVWRVQGALIQRHWMPKSVFQHEPHFAMECVACHAATTSTESSDILMPEIGLCQDCHMGEAAGSASASSECLACHEYHIDGYKPMSPPHAEAFSVKQLAAERVEVRPTAGQ